VSLVTDAKNRVTLEAPPDSPSDDPVLEVSGEAAVPFIPRWENPVPPPGTLIAGKYVVENVIGEGGLGIVLSARHQKLDQQVAIKILRLDMTHSPSTVERFVREGQLVAKIHSEHVVRVYDVGTLENGTPFIVLEYLHGLNLAKVLSEKKRLPVEMAVDYVLEACEALAEAHSLGIVHRDLKPDNMFVARKAAGSTVVKILDFGISKLAQKDGESWKRVTQDGDRFGTPAYMSPEQLKSAAKVSPTSDIWSMGVVLYELLTGILPFDGIELPELITNILTKPPLPLRAHCPAAPPELEVVLNRCLTKKAAQRYRNVAELAQDLAPFGNPATAPRSLAHIRAVITEVGDSIRPPSFPSLQINELMRELDKGPPSSRRSSGSFPDIEARTDPMRAPAAMPIPTPVPQTLITWDSITLPPNNRRRIALAVLAVAVVSATIVLATHKSTPPAASRAAASPPAASAEPAPTESAGEPPVESAGASEPPATSAPAAPAVSASRPAAPPHHAPATAKPGGKNAGFGGRL
jgi:serine/threonine protein kinase